ncbi:hypothetical protein R1sor_025535 [Riccia sorocarpa]|uniref:SWIM-type domain-containing protein n=1 Tax=Riccia sorocarpa TaxID=122646 RepID=A0ABD3G8X2_9MARC
MIDPWQKSVEFMAKWKQHSSFVQYYEKNWHNRINRWAKAYRMYAHANQESQGSIERWHATLKQYLRGSKKGKMSRRVVWLVSMLTDKIEPFYYCSAELKQQGHLRNRIVASLVIAAIRKARDIPITDVIQCVEQNGKKIALVTSQSRRDCLHEVRGWDSDDCTCTCGFSIQGNACKHQIRCLMSAGYSEVELLHMLGTKWGTDAGGSQNIHPMNTLGSLEVANMGLGTDLEPLNDLDDSEDYVMLSSSPMPEVHIGGGSNGQTLDSNGRRKLMFSDFQREIANLYKVVSSSNHLCEQAFQLVMQTINQSLRLKAAGELNVETRGGSQNPEEFEETTDNEKSLKRKRIS